MKTACTTSHLAQCLMIAACALLMACGRQPQLKYWQTDERATDKPAVNYVVSQNPAGEMDLAKVILRAERPADGAGIQEREMGFIVTRRTKEKLIFELREAPGEIIGINLPPSISKSFEAEIISKQGVGRRVVFRQTKR